MSILCCFARPSSETRPGRPHPGDINNLNDSYNTSSSNNNNNNYISQPPPRYTPRPTTIHEKTLEAHLRDPPISSSDCPAIIDEKRRQEFAFSHPEREREREDVTSDVSSALSFPSSYGNTSTATRETPPPPYSPRHSQSMSIPFSRGQSPTRSRRVSVSSPWSGAHTPTSTPGPGSGLTTPPMAHIAQRRSVPGGRRGRESWSARSSFEERMRRND